MPEMTGWELLDALGEQWPGVPSMVVSAYGNEENARRAVLPPILKCAKSLSLSSDSVRLNGRRFGQSA